MEIEIRTLADVVPHISYDAGMVVGERDGYSFVDYNFVVDGTFANPVAQQCRGLKFDTEGNLIARPFHKFFNIGEREQPHEIDWSRPHVVMDKLDGSMVHPAILNGDLVFMTRKGLSAQARAAGTVASVGVRRLSADLLAAGRTPIFEYTAPENRIVVAYDAPALTLLAVRDTVSGAYALMEELYDLARPLGVPVVQVFDPVGDIHAFIQEGRVLEEVEGRVVAFEDGSRYKLKANAYVLRHRALSGMDQEKNLLKLIAEDALDDVLPLLPPDVAQRAEAYRTGLFAVLAEHLTTVERVVSDLAGESPADRARGIQSRLDKRLQPAAFFAASGKPPRDALMKIVAYAGGSGGRVDAVRDLLRTRWDGVQVDIEG